MSEAEILKLLLSEKYEEKVKESNVLDLESYTDVRRAKAQVRIPRRRLNLLAMAGSFKAAPDLSRNKKNAV